MSNLFDIQALSETTIKLTENLQTKLEFSVTNTSGFNMNARAQIEPPEVAKWVTIDEPVRRIADSMTEQFSANLLVPKGTKAGDYNFTFDVVDSEHPDDNFQKGPNIKLEVPVSAPAHNYTPYIIAAVVAAVLLIGGIIAAVVLLTGGPSAEFNYAVSETNPLEVNFSLIEADENATYLWDFGDGNTATGAAVSHVYTEGRDYTVSLDVNEGKAHSEATFSLIAPPLANFSVSLVSGSAPLTVDFVNNSSGNIDSYAWDFDGDGTVDSTDAFGGSHTYTTSGVYNATLVVTGPAGEDDMVQSIGVDEIPPVAMIYASTTAGQAPLTVTFVDQSTGDVNSREWDFNGDGTIDSGDSPVSYTFNTAGIYNVGLRVLGDGGESSTFVEINVAAENLVANFNADPSTGTAPLLVSFTDASVGNIASYAWDFDNNGTVDSTEQNPSYTFGVGTYSVKLTVTGIGGGTDEIFRTVSVGTSPTSRFLGTWNNVDAATNGITTFSITQSGNQLLVQMWGSCSPTDCDWGTTTTTTADAQDSILNLVWNQGFVVRQQTVTYLDNGQLRLVSISDYNDDRPTRTDIYTFEPALVFFVEPIFIQPLAPIFILTETP